MATFRVGIGSFIITEDKGVGFGTSPTDGLGNLKVKGCLLYTSDAADD